MLVDIHIVRYAYASCITERLHCVSTLFYCLTCLRPDEMMEVLTKFQLLYYKLCCSERSMACNIHISIDSWQLSTQVHKPPMTANTDDATGQPPVHCAQKSQHIYRCFIKLLRAGEGFYLNWYTVVHWLEKRLLTWSCSDAKRRLLAFALLSEWCNCRFGR